MMQNKTRVIALVLFATLIAGCQPDNGFADLQEFMDQTRAKPKGQIQPLPKFVTYEAFAYSAAGLRSPFLPLAAAVAIDGDSGEPETTVRPDENRVKQYLEGFDVASFIMVGSMSNDEGVWALLRGANGVHRVKVGDYLGTNHGRIFDIDDQEIRIIEIVPSGKDVWVERPRSISLAEGS